MTDAALQAGAAWLAVALALVSVAGGIGAALARTLLVVVLYACVSAISGAVAVTMLGARDAGLAVMIVGVGWAPVALLAGISLGSRVARSTRRVLPWMSAAAVVLIVGVVVWAAHGLPGGVAQAPSSHAIEGLGEPQPLWLALLALATGGGCVALLGYGERGAFQRGAKRGAP